MNEYAWAFLSAGVVSLISLGGLIAMPLGDKGLRRITFILVSLATGALYGDALFHLLPAVFRHDSLPLRGSLWVTAGILVSFLFEKVLRWKDHHSLEETPGIKPVGKIILFSDGLHNVVDGILIGASYLANRDVGIATTLAVALHELPHEMGDFGVLIDAGYSKSRALLFNFLCACLSLIGVAVAFGFHSAMDNFPWIALPFTAGSFLYIAGSNLTPELQKEYLPVRSLIQCEAMIAGIALMAWLAFSE